MDKKTKEAIVNFLQSRRFQNYCFMLAAGIICYLTGKRILKYYGAKPSPRSKNDYSISMAQAPQAYPQEFQIPFPRLKNQGSVGSCVAHSISYLTEFLLPKSGDYNLDRASVGWIYGYRPDGYYKGEGMYPRQAFKTLQEKGAIRHRDFPYNEEVPGIINRVNSNLEDLLKKAEPNKIPVFFQLKSDEEIKECLMNHGPVSIMFPVYDSFNTPVNNKIESATGKFYGYHQVTLYGWKEGYWIMVNSWGNWDEDGIALISMKYTWREAWGASIKNEAVVVPSKKNFFSKVLDWVRKVFG